jgi:hypothetical protein
MLYSYIKQTQMPHLRTYHPSRLQVVAVLIRHVICLLIKLKPNAHICVIGSYPFLQLFSWQYPFSQLLACVEGEAQNIFNDIQNLLTTHRSEMTHFTQELRAVSCYLMNYTAFLLEFYSRSALSLSLLLLFMQSFRISLDRTKEMSTYIIGLFDKYLEETSKLHNHSNSTHEVQMKSIEDFQKAYKVSHLPF